jgi:hypothetical protein
MFRESSCAILFNPWDDKPKKHADFVIEEKNLALVLDQICESLSIPKP